MNTKYFVYKLLFLLLPFSILEKATAQNNYFYNDKFYESSVILEIGASIGGMNCLTDLGGRKGMGEKFTKDINLQNTKLCGGIYLGIMYKDIVGLRMEATFGSVTAYDSILKPVAASALGRYERNLSFRSSIGEIALIGEFHPLMLLNFPNRNMPHLSPYLLAGIGAFSFNPQTFYKGSWIDLKPLHLEGQGFKEYPTRHEYKLTSICYPIGVGMRYEINNYFVLRMEIIHRITGTDYLDDVSQENYVDPQLFSSYLNPANAYLANQLYDRHKELNPSFINSSGDFRGYSNNNDSYFSFNIKLGLTLGRKRR